MNKDINVCVINPDFFRSSGVTIAIKNLHKALENYNIKYFFIDCDIRNNDSDPYFNTTKFNLFKPQNFKFWIDFFKFIKYLKTTNIDIIHVHHRRLLIIMWLVSKITKIPLVYTGHLVYNSSLKKRILNFENGIAITESVKEDMSKEFNFKSIHMISNAIDFPDKMYINNNRNKVVICVGRLDEVKNHQLLLKAWEKSNLQNKGWKLELYGEGNLENELKDLSKSLSISNSLVFKGFKKDWKNEAQNASFAVLPSYVEGQGLVTIESSLLGIPSLVSNVPGSKDCIPKNFELCNLFSPNDVEQLSNYLIKWSESNILEQEALKIFEFNKKISYSEMVASKTAKLYESILSKKDSK